MTDPTITAAIIGGGPSGLIAAEILTDAGVAVTIFDHMPSFGRKLLMAGRGGLNLTHAEPLERFLTRYGAARDWLEPAIRAFPPEALIAWCHALGQETFTGSSARVFPRVMKASPLLRAWLARLTAAGVAFRTRHRWTGWSDAGALNFITQAGPITENPDITILAAGGASWPRLGSDAQWTDYLFGCVTPFRPGNCGFLIDWSAHLRVRCAGRPLKRIALTAAGRTVRGEATISETGLEGGVVYALSAPIRDAIAAHGPLRAHLDLRPDLDILALSGRLATPRRGQSLSVFLRKQAGLPPEAIVLVQEAIHNGANPDDLAGLIKAVPLTFRAPYPITGAISSAGGLSREAVDAHFMLRARPGVFAAGEMLDWEAPTGGYLLQACFSTGVAAAHGALAWRGITSSRSASHAAPATPSPHQVPRPSSPDTA